MRILETIMRVYQGGPVGVETVACMIDEDVRAVEEAYEPYLMRLGYLERTSRGRKIPDGMRDVIAVLLAQKRG
jgi:Holliday junction DNA helicase RuvB